MIHLPYDDRMEAGRLLADELYRRKFPGDLIVLALTRGGVPLGFAVADRLQLPLDVVVVRKIGVPWQPELAMGAIAGKAQVLDDGMIRELNIDAREVNEIVAREQAEMNRREGLYRGGRPPLDLQGRTVLLVDDGLATGSTMLAAIRHVRSLKAAKVIIAVPVGSREACNRLRKEADDLVCLAAPELFFAVGEWFRKFPQVTDSEVQNLLAESSNRLSKKQTAPGAA